MMILDLKIKVTDHYHGDPLRNGRSGPVKKKNVTVN